MSIDEQIALLKPIIDQLPACPAKMVLYTLVGSLIAGNDYALMLHTEPFTTEQLVILQSRS